VFFVYQCKHTHNSMRNNIEIQQPLFKEFEIDKIAEGISFIRDNIGTKTAFVGFSGGKDSIVTADLMKRSGVKYELYYSFTGIDPPEVVRFIRKYYPECIFLKPKQTFWRNLSVHTPPSDRLRWCCTSLKKESGWDVPLEHRVMGIRKEESSKRSKYPRINFFEKLRHTHYYPILNFNEADIWEYIKSNELPYPSLYDEGFDRLGCIVCPYHSERTGKKHKQYRDRWPKYFNRFERGIKELYNKRVSQGKTMHYDTPEEFIQAWYVKNSARWYKEVERATQTTLPYCQTGRV